MLLMTATTVRKGPITANPAMEPKMRGPSQSPRFQFQHIKDSASSSAQTTSFNYTAGKARAPAAKGLRMVCMVIATNVNDQ
jgi:hypothetical protein